MDANAVNCGWLFKSPPEKLLTWKTWTRRWFVLRNTGQIPGQYFLEYYTDQTCRKLKGRVNLDQCKQVDSNLSNCNRQFMFDIITDKRVYYFAADSEAEMKKWIDCICSVCGQKVKYEDYRYSPQPSQEYLDNASSSNSNNASASSRNLSNSNNNIRSSSNRNLSTSSLTSNKSRTDHVNSHPSTVIKTEPLSRSNSDRLSTSSIVSATTSSKKKYEPSGPYVPIWETNTGKPIVDRLPLKEATNSRDNISSIPLQSLHSSLNRNHSAQHPENDAYDIPRPLNISSNVSTNACDDVLNKVLPTPKNFNSTNSNDPAPKINWKTHPTETSETSAIVVGVSGSRTLTKTKSQTSKDIHHIETRRASTPSTNYYNSESILLNELHPPPRPPKPENLRKSRNNSESYNTNGPEASSPSYDIPNTSNISNNNSKIVETEKRDVVDNSPTSKTPLNSVIRPPGAAMLAAASVSIDDMYDIPKPTDQQQANVGDVLNTAIPVNTLKKQGLHSYSNAPVGHVSTKETFFVYDSKPCLPTTSDDQIANFDNESLDRSPLSPTSPLYTNFTQTQTMTPPAVNRDLKPRRKGSDSDATASPTTPGPPFTLFPVPGDNIYQNKNFRKPSPNRQLNGTAPRIPSRNRQIAHSREPSASEDEFCRSRRNSNDDQVRKTIPAPPRKTYSEFGEIQYLDLSLGDNNSTTVNNNKKSSHNNNSSNKLNKKGCDNHKSLSSLTKENNDDDNASPSTVYKTVDFLKTKAFNKLRLNLEGSFRNSQ